MAKIDIALLERGHARVQALEQHVLATAPASHMLLFSSDDVQGTVYGIAGILWEDVGMGLLVRRGEESLAPHILGVWVRPEYRRQGVGRELLRVLAATSQHR